MTELGKVSDLRLIREGLCPYRHGPLERRDGYGWCRSCEAGYSTEGNSFFTLHFEGEWRGGWA